MISQNSLLSTKTQAIKSLSLSINETEKIDYLPFGKRIPRDNADQRTAYIGKELDTESELGDHGVRKVDYELGRFTTIDPLWEKYYAWSPYQYSMNNPVSLADWNGLAWKPIIHSDDDGNKTYTGFEWINKENSYDENGNLHDGLYEQAIFFSDNGTFDSESNFNMGSSTATVYLADGTTTTYDATTKPANDSYAEVSEGIYEANVGTHKGYTALKMRDIGASSQTIELGSPNPSDPTRTYAIGIDVHKAGKKNKTGLTNAGNPISAGCSLIDRDSWDSFISYFSNSSQKLNTVGIIISRTVYTLPSMGNFGAGSRMNFLVPKK